MLFPTELPKYPPASITKIEISLFDDENFLIFPDFFRISWYCLKFLANLNFGAKRFVFAFYSPLSLLVIFWQEISMANENIKDLFNFLSNQHLSAAANWSAAAKTTANTLCNSAETNWFVSYYTKMKKTKSRFKILHFVSISWDFLRFFLILRISFLAQDFLRIRKFP
jgi:hypothetical protein